MNAPIDRRYGIGHGYAVRIAELVDELGEWASTLDPEIVHRRPPDGEWTVAQNLVHVVEFVPYWAGQLHRVVAHPGQPFGRTHEDPERIAWVDEHAGDALDAILAALPRAADEACRLLCSIPDGAWGTTGRHRRGEMTLGDIAEFFLVDHLEDHGRQARAAWLAVSDRTGARP